MSLILQFYKKLKEFADLKEVADLLTDLDELGSENDELLKKCEDQFLSLSSQTNTKRGDLTLAELAADGLVFLKQFKGEKLSKSELVAIYKYLPFDYLTAPRETHAQFRGVSGLGEFTKRTSTQLLGRLARNGLFSQPSKVASTDADLDIYVDETVSALASKGKQSISDVDPIDLYNSPEWTDLILGRIS